MSNVLMSLGNYNGTVYQLQIARTFNPLLPLDALFRTVHNLNSNLHLQNFGVIQPPPCLHPNLYQ